MADLDTQGREGVLEQVDPFVLSSLEAMRRKLLDLTSRNRLLNYPVNQKGSVLRIVDELPDQLYMALNSEMVMEFAPVPEPTRQQLLDYGYLAVGPNGQDIQRKAHPGAVEWAGVLGIKTEFALPYAGDTERTAQANGDLLGKARAFIQQYAQDNNGKLTGIRAQYGKQLIDLNALTSACRQAGYASLDTFEQQAKVGASLGVATVIPEHEDNRIQVLLYPGELEARLRTIHNKAQTAIEESGAGILYLALGFLEWYESDTSDKARLAPLFTIPVRLERGKLDPKDGLYKYQLHYTGEDILPNLSLKEKLQADFGLGLPTFDEPPSPEAYLASVIDVVEQHKPRWRVRRYGCLNLLNFSKMVMYLDLDPARWPRDQRNITAHEVIRRLFTSQGGEGTGSGGSGMPQGEHDIDASPDIHNEVPLIDDADSSQHSALIDAIRGQNLVIEGPPGSGKSQTITNLIAAALQNGKRVLFVAEKMAALEVVKRRLDKAGLGDFCLELHSHKTHKRKVLDELQCRLDLAARTPSKEEIDAQITRYEELKAQLNQYAALINSQWQQTGKSIHQILSAATRYRSQLDIDATGLHVDGVSGKRLDKVAQLRLRDQIVAFSRIYKEVREQVGDQAEIYDHPWGGVTNTQIQLFDSQRIVDLLQQWQTGLCDFQGGWLQFLRSWELDGQAVQSLTEIDQFFHDLARLPELSGQEQFAALPALTDRSTREQIRQLMALFVELQACYGILGDVIHTHKLTQLVQGDELTLPQDELAQYGVAETFTLMDLIKWQEGVDKAGKALDELNSQLAEFRAALPGVITSQMATDKHGLMFSSILLKLIASLPAELIRLRDELFDDDEVDAVLLDLSRQLEVLRPLRDNLSAIYLLDRLPPCEQLTQAVATLNQGNLFSWFKRDWRAAKTLLTGLARQPNAKFSDLKRWANNLVKYAGQLEMFEQSGFGQRLGSAFCGLETDPEQLLQLREWYKKVRSVYGIGFGPHVAVGSAVLTVDGAIIKGVHLLEQQQLSAHLTRRVQQLEDLLLQMPNLASSLGKNPQWLGAEGLLAHCSERIQTTLRSLQQWFVHNDVSLGQMRSFATELKKLIALQSRYQASESMLGIFEGLPPLEYGPGRHNQYTLEVMNATLSLVDHLVNDLASKTFVERICQMPDATVYMAFRSDGAQLALGWQRQELSSQAFTEQTKLDKVMWLKSTDHSLASLIERNQKAIECPRWLNGWVNFVRNREQMHEQGLQRIWEAVLSGRLSIEQVEQGLALAIYDQLAREIHDAHPELNRVSGSERNACQKAFKEYDKKLIELQRQRIVATLLTRSVPAGNAGGKKSEYTDRALILNELGKKTKHIPIRQLINRAGHALQALKPCFMMGPMSAANYLAPGELEFDLVVMDEASQVKPEDSLGVIARGKQLVVVGDPKQLPPTSFFDRSADDLDDDEVAAVSDTDSILDAALPLFPMRRLRWHYRSQHENLIAYSNRHFYNSDLVIFPSPYAKSPEYGIKFTHVAKGRFSNQHNIEEAQVVAEAVVRHAIERPEESLGVVAMSSKQRDQIERALDELRRSRAEADVAIERLLAHQDPLFIKNLENVQGDERDVIFISFTYGPAELGGKVYQRFGPINSDVGWRRLNVLFTRSKKRMHVFSSMRSDDVLTSETSKRGVLALKGFLQYAEKGYLDAQTRHTGKAPDSDFEIAVMEALYKEGFECEPQVGVAGFFIDLAVIDPGCPGRYLMGIECDGAAYHSAKSARDRDRLRQEVLERLGWTIKRIWSTDWFGNPDEVLSPIIRELHVLKTPMTATSTPGLVSDWIMSGGVQEEILPTEQPAPEMPVIPELGLKEQLRHFANHVIDVTFPDVEEDKRLLRPSMIEALLEHQPLSRSEFAERIPKYLREATDIHEAHQFLDQVLALIDGSITEEDVVGGMA